MKMNLIAASMVIAVVTAFGQVGVVEDVKHGAKKAGETIKDGLETVGEKTKEAGQTVARKTKETVKGTDQEAPEKTTRKNHHRSGNSLSRANAENTEGQPANRETNTPPRPAPVVADGDLDSFERANFYLAPIGHSRFIRIDGHVSKF